MKQRMVLLILCLVLILSNREQVFAQRSTTKCPPKKSFWKSKEQRHFVRVHESWKPVKERRRAESVNDRTPKEKVVEKQDKEPRDNYYVKQRARRVKMPKTSKGDIASVHCPH